MGSTVVVEPSSIGLRAVTNEMVRNDGGIPAEGTPDDVIRILGDCAYTPLLMPIAQHAHCSRPTSHAV
eukprot:COSAG02_NODE_25493_length_657_cov_1.005376_1_plen_67_part_01